MLDPLHCELYYFSAICVPDCLHGDCINPDKCYCHSGYAGSTCSEGINSFLQIYNASCSYCLLVVLLT